MSEEKIFITIYIAGVISIWIFTAYSYGMSPEKDKESNGFVFVPFAALAWPIGILFIPPMVVVKLFIEIGKYVKNKNR